MLYIPSESKKIEVEGATVDFFELAKDGVSTYYFDTSKEGPPHPMVNAMSGLKLIKNTKNKLVMINHKSPGGLFSKLEDDISYIVQELDDGSVKVVFSNVDGVNIESDLTQTSCAG
jgi:dGTP triphosphohydrolase